MNEKQHRGVPALSDPQIQLLKTELSGEKIAVAESLPYMSVSWDGERKACLKCV